MKVKANLTKGELQLMNILWDMPEGACAWDVLERYPDPKPAYSTVATNLKVLYAKEFVAYRKGQGKTHTYYPLISRESYTRLAMHEMKQSLFGGNTGKMVRFFVEEEELSESEIRELVEMVQMAAG